MQKILSLLLLTVLLSACAGPQTAYIQGSKQEIATESENQKKMALQQWYRNELRLSSVAYPLLTRNTALCGDKVGPYHGFSAWTSDGLPRTYRETASRAFGLTQAATIFAVVPGSPAARAGLSRGDKIVQASGKKINQGTGGLRQLASYTKSKSYEPLVLGVERGGKSRKVAVKPVSACKYPVVLQTNNQTINAMADGKAVLIPQGMLRFAKSDTELAFVTAHELAHNASGHMTKRMQNAIGAGIVGLLLEAAVASGGGYANGSITQSMMDAGAQAYSVEFEQEADYVGMYMLAKAGYPTTGIGSFWRRMASEVSPDSIQIRSSHPTSPERFVALEKTGHEIAGKRASGKTLLPNMATAKRSTGGSKYSSRANTLN